MYQKRSKIRFLLVCSHYLDMFVYNLNLASATKTLDFVFVYMLIEIEKRLVFAVS